jgi:predicted RNA-binding Zn ribbon-like protein
MVTSMSTGTVSFREGAGRLCLDFLRTLRYRGTDRATEELSEPGSLAAWILQFGPGDHSMPREPDLAELAYAHELREAVYELIQAGRSSAGPRSCGLQARERVNHAASHPVQAPSLDASGNLKWDADDPVRATLSLIARDAIDLVCSDAITRVRECAGPDCGAMFSDCSRPGNRRWCSMGSCGNRAKKSALRIKAAQV